ncbi:MAG: DUF6602 domain-containing protein [Ectopseudomonas guguanensis]|uniref:DUF6602 domain-containing protein n=1 Tax=Ectopseudomonas guguanensis TaxID=1198456 RepID=UPI00391B89B1
MSDQPRPKRGRVTSARKQRDELEESQTRTKEWLTSQTTRAIKLRSKDKEFHGLERELVNLQAKMLRDYEISKDIKHPRDVGNVRETLLRNFFIETRLLPRKFSVSETSIRAASTSGHLSNELDILFYDALDSFTLMQRHDVYEVLPVEYCYGAIQVKSKLTKAELKSAFNNIASFKRLKRMQDNRPVVTFGNERIEHNGFGIIFAYDTDLDWITIAREFESHANSYERNALPNALFILSKGFFMYGNEQFSSIFNSHIESHETLKVSGHPDHQGYCLYQLYETVFSLLRCTRLQSAHPKNYFRLPLTAGKYSYEYSFGGFAEFGKCEEHGDFSRLYTPTKLEKIITWCQTAEPINWIKANDIAYGKAGDDFEAYARQPGDVRIYNPENLPLTEILVHDAPFLHEGKEIIGKALSYDVISSEGLMIFIPYYYQVTEQLVQSCPKCQRKTKAKRTGNQG